MLDDQTPLRLGDVLRPFASAVSSSGKIVGLTSADEWRAAARLLSYLEENRERFGWALTLAVRDAGLNFHEDSTPALRDLIQLLSKMEEKP